MGQNYQSVGFNISAKSDGFVAGVKNALSSMTSLVTGTTSMSDAFARVGTTGINLTTDYESLVQKTGVSVRKLLGQQGLFGKELNKSASAASGLAIGMQVSNETAAHAVAAFHKFGNTLKAMGVTSAAVGVKVEDGLGIPIMDLGLQSQQMAKSLNLNSKQVADSMALMVGTGTALHDIPGTFKLMGKEIELATARSNLLARGLSSIGGKQAMDSVNMAIQRMYALTGDAEGSKNAVLGLEEVMSSSLKEFGNMFAGTSSELNNFLVGTSVVAGDVNQAFKMAQQGPDAFLNTFAQIFSKLKKDGKSTAEILNFFGGQIEKSLGPEKAEVFINAFSKVDEAKLKTIDATKILKKQVGEAGKDVWRSSMTMAEALQLAMGAGEAEFRQIGMHAAQTFLHDIPKAYKSFNQASRALVEEGGPFGSFVEKLSEASSIGATAFLPKFLQPAAHIFGDLYGKLKPNLDAFGGFIDQLTTFKGASSALVTGILGMHAAFAKARKEGKTTREFGHELGKQISEGIKSFFGGAEGIGSIFDTFKLVVEEIESVFETIDWSGIWKSVSDTWESLKTTVDGLIRKVFGLQAGQSTWDDGIKPWVTHWWNKLVDWFEKTGMPWVKGILLKGLNEILKAITESDTWTKYVKPVINIIDEIKGAFDRVKNAIDLIQKVAQPLIDVFNRLAGPILNLMGAIDRIKSVQASLPSGIGGGGDATKAQFRADTRRDIQTQILEQTALPKWYTEIYHMQFENGVYKIVTAIQHLEQMQNATARAYQIPGSGGKGSGRSGLPTAPLTVGVPQPGTSGNE